MGGEEEGGAVKEGVRGEEDDRVDEDGGPDCGCELVVLVVLVIVFCVEWRKGRETHDPDARLGDDGGACKYTVSVTIYLQQLEEGLINQARNSSL